MPGEGCKPGAGRPAVGGTPGPLPLIAGGCCEKLTDGWCVLGTRAAAGAVAEPTDDERLDVETIVGGVLWILANVVYWEARREGERGCRRFLAFWLGFPTTILSLLFIPEGSQPPLRNDDRGLKGLVQEIRRDRGVRGNTEGGSGEEGVRGAQDQRGMRPSRTLPPTREG